jgi:hypothetical protein
MMILYYIIYSIQLQDIQLRFTVTERDDSILAAPCPLPRLGVVPALRLTEFLVFTWLQTHNNICFAGAEGENAYAGAGAQRANGCCKGGCWVPGGLSSG